MAVARGLASVKTVTLNLTGFATPYSPGDVLGSVVEIPGAVAGPGCCAILENITVLDKAKISQPLDIYFFSKSPASSIGTDNNAFAVDDTDLLLLLGVVSVSTYNTGGSNNSLASSTAIGMLLQPGNSPTGSNNQGSGGATAANKNTSIYMAVVSRTATTATYTSTSDLVFKIGLLQE